MKLSRQETIEREARRRAYEAQIKEGENQRKLIKKLDFEEKSFPERAGIYFLKAIGIALGLFLIAALLLGGG